MNHTKRSSDLVIQIRRLTEKLKHGTLDSDEKLAIEYLLKSNTHDSSCLLAAESDEPVFVLRAHDPIAANTVAHWVADSLALGLHRDKIEDARSVVTQMLEWRQVRAGLKAYVDPGPVVTDEFGEAKEAKKTS